MKSIYFYFKKYFLFYFIFGLIFSSSAYANEAKSSNPGNLSGGYSTNIDDYLGDDPSATRNCEDELEMCNKRKQQNSIFLPPSNQSVISQPSNNLDCQISYDQCKQELLKFKPASSGECPTGSAWVKGTADQCKCFNDTDPIMKMGPSGRSCPYICKTKPNSVFNPATEKCECMDGYKETMDANSATDHITVMTCTPISATKPSDASVHACLQEAQAKVDACTSAETSAKQQCQTQERSDSDGIDSLFRKIGPIMQSQQKGSGAVETCVAAGIAGSTGYYAIEALRNKCDGEISNCKSSCDEALSYLNDQELVIYSGCLQNYIGDKPLPPDQYEAIEKAYQPEFNRKIEAMKEAITNSQNSCSNGQPKTDREKMESFMKDMDRSVKGANQCQCQLTSGGPNCGNPIGPSDCALNPNLPGCATSTVNCLNPNDKTPLCACFRNPTSPECLAANGGQPIPVSQLPTVGGVVTGLVNPLTGLGAPKPNNSAIDNLDYSDLNSTSSGKLAASGSAVGDSALPFGAAGSAGGAGGFGGGGGGGASSAAGLNSATESEGTGSRLQGLLNTARTGLGNLFKNQKNTTQKIDSKSFKDRQKSTGKIDPGQWRPQGLVRGLAGQSELARKNEDIWKVINKQYKVQDQKDQFIFEFKGQDRN